jgi:hypothetical protein
MYKQAMSLAVVVLKHRIENDCLLNLSTTTKTAL